MVHELIDQTTPAAYQNGEFTASKFRGVSNDRLIEIGTAKFIP
jgi:hypothetical protein